MVSVIIKKPHSRVFSGLLYGGIWGSEYNYLWGAYILTTLNPKRMISGPYVLEKKNLIVHSFMGVFYVHRPI